MKIGLVRRGYSSSGGAESYLLRLSAALNQAGHELTLFSDVTWPDTALTEAGVTYRQVTLATKDPLKFAERFDDSRIASGCDLFLSLERVFSCDVFRAGDGLHASWLERRAAFEPSWKRIFRPFNRKHAATLKLERRLFSEHGAKRVIANSKLVRDEIIDRYGYPSDRIDVVYNGVPPANPAPDARSRLRADLGFSPEAYLVIFVGSGWDRKGLEFALRALEDVPGAHLLVAGRGKERNVPRTHFLGPRRDIQDLLAAADAFILPTIYDPFSNASLEALAAGLPVITTRANGCSEIITPGRHGSIVERPDDVPALTAALQHWSDKANRQATYEACTSLASDFTIWRNLAETIAVLERCVGD